MKQRWTSSCERIHWSNINIKKSNRYTLFQYMHKEQSKTITTVSSALTTSRNRVPFYSKIQSHVIQIWYENLALILIEGKSGFVSHTKLIAEATFMVLFHSWLITCIMWFSELENKIAYLGAVKFKTKD